MTKKVLAVSRQQDQINGIIVEKKGAGLFAGEPIDLSSSGALKSACQSVDQIYVCDTFLSAVYVRDNFPKLKPKHLSGLLRQDAAKRFPAEATINTVFKPTGHVIIDGIERQEVSYISIEDEKVEQTWETFSPFQSKIKGVTPLASALAALVAKSEDLEKDFIIAQLGATESVILVTSAKGEVKVVRNLALGTKGLDLTNQEVSVTLAQRVDKEINRTINFYKQEFRAAAPNMTFIFGHKDLPDVFQATPLSLPDMTLRFELVTPLVENYSAQVFTENIHIIAGFFLDEHFNFIPRQMSARAKARKIFFPIYIVLGLVICAMAIWAGALFFKIQKEKAALKEKHQTAKSLKKEVENLQFKVSKLSALEGWEQFYSQTFNAQMPWDRLFSELGAKTPTNVVIDSMALMPNKATKDWAINISGQIRSENWETGLAEFRQFGAKLDTSPLYRIKAVNYEPKELEEKKRMFSFQMLLEFK